MAVGYLRFVIDNGRFLAFGFLFSLCSSFGQTFFIALFGGEIRAAFDLGHGGFGMVYSVGTLAGGLCLMWFGRAIDRVDLRVFGVLVALGLALACLLMAAAPSVVLLLGAVFALRLTGQGLMTHTAVTSMARYFDAGRGKAVSIAALGMPAGEVVFPLLAVALIGAIGWRATWAASGVALALLLPPLALWLLRGHGERHRGLLERAAAGGGPAAGGDGRPAARQWTRGEVLRDPTFYLILLAVMAPSFITTGLFFHQVHVAAAKGWSLAWLASCFIVFALVSTAVALALGPLVDRFGARRLLPYYLPPLGLGLIVLAAFDHKAAAVAYMAALALTSGASTTVINSAWAEIYGVASLGAIRSLVASLLVLASALSPVLVGWVIDLGTGIEAVALACLGYVAVGTVMLALAARRAQMRPSSDRMTATTTTTPMM